MCIRWQQLGRAGAEGAEEGVRGVPRPGAYSRHWLCGETVSGQPCPLSQGTHSDLTQWIEEGRRHPESAASRRSRALLERTAPRADGKGTLDPGYNSQHVGTKASEQCNYDSPLGHGDPLLHVFLEIQWAHRRESAVGQLAGGMQEGAEDSGGRQPARNHLMSGRCRSKRQTQAS